MINAKYLVVETGEMLEDIYEAFCRFDEGYNIVWFLDGEPMSKWEEEKRAEVHQHLFGNN